MINIDINIKGNVSLRFFLLALKLKCPDLLYLYMSIPKIPDNSNFTNVPKQMIKEKLSLRIKSKDEKEI